jgi:hypothetical protein
MAATLRLRRISKLSHRHTGREQLARFRPMNELIPFMSRCPRCGYRRLQDGYTHRVLRRLLNTNAIIEGYCATCDAFWPIGALERSGIALAFCD